MQFNLTIGSPVINRKDQNLYRVTVRFMHGDADGTTYKTFDFPVGKNVNGDGLSINNLLTYLKAFFDLEWNDGCDFTDGGDFKMEVLNKAGLDEDDVELIEDAGMWEHDITCEDRQARPREVTITYFDELGVEHKVDIYESDTQNQVKFEER